MKRELVVVVVQVMDRWKKINESGGGRRGGGGGGEGESIRGSDLYDGDERNQIALVIIEVDVVVVNKHVRV